MKAFLTLLFYPLITLAQTDTLGANDLRDRAFQMAKATVEFLATDAKTYGYLDKTTCPECVSYPRLKAFINTQRLTKANELVDETERWTINPTTTAKSPTLALAELRTQLINRVTAGNDRQHRRSLPSFATYANQMNQLAGGAAPASLALNTAQQTDAPDATADLQDAQSDTAFVDETVQPLSQVGAADNSWLSKSGLALILALISLGLSGWLLATRSRKTAVNSAGLDPETDKAVARLNDDLFHLKGERNRTQEAVKKLEERIAQLTNQVAVLQKAVGVASTVPQPAIANLSKDTPPPTPAPAQYQQTQSGMSSGPAPANPVPAQPKTAPAPAENRPRTPAPNPPVSTSSPSPAATSFQAKMMYARTVDLGDGFSADSLSETTTERPMIYQIQIQAPGQATFRVADDPYAQRLALSDPYSYLNDACEYNSQPASNSRIQTTKPGRLALQGTKWVIQEKAQISFA